MRRPLATLAAGLALALAACGGEKELGRCETPPAAAGAAEVRWVGPAGDDTAAGTCAAPWRTLEHALDEARPGMAIILRPGTYGRRGTRILIRGGGDRGNPIVVAGHQGRDETTVLGAVKVEGEYVTLNGLRFRGPTGPVVEREGDNPTGESVVVDVEGDGVEISDSEVTGGLWHAGIFVADGKDVRLLRNHIHRNGAFDRPEQANLDHGIYFGSGSGLVASNLVEGNLAYGIHLYPRASDVTVAYNTVVRNGRAGIIIADESADNLVVGNVVAENKDLSIRSSDLTAGGNRAVANLVWRNAGGATGTAAEGIEFEGTIEKDPRFEDGWRLGDDSPAEERGPRVEGAELDFDRRRREGDKWDLGAFVR